MVHQISFSHAVDGFFLQAESRRLSPHTLADYRNTFNKFEVWLEDHHPSGDYDPPLVSITKQHIEQFLSAYPHLSKKTVRNYHTGLSALYTWAVASELVETHIPKQVTPPKPEKRAIIPLSQQEVKAMLDACQHVTPYSRPGKRTSTHTRPTALRDKAIILTLLDTGIRASECVNLTIANVELGRGDRQKRIFIRSGKNDKDRYIPISSRTAQAIWRYLTTRPDDTLDKPLFSALNGAPLSRQALLRVIKHCGERANVVAHPHKFRHTFAITFLRNYPDIYALQMMLGHESLDMVKRYLSLAQNDLDRAHLVASPVENWSL
jgi:integrase/recombinase XerD